jgi:hypothetical protein
MRCFNHAEVEAVGICKSCCKGICTQCAADLGHGLACKNSHEQRVEAVDAIMERGTKIQSINTKNKFLMPSFYAFMGLAFLGYGIANHGSSYFIVMGAGFLAFSIATFVINQKAYSK